jgi:hypothetical protein
VLDARSMRTRFLPPSRVRIARDQLDPDHGYGDEAYDCE